MYAILEDGSKQYQVSPGDTIDIETRAIAEGQNILEFDRILLLKDDKSTKVGTPIIPGAKVTARINSPVKGPKIKDAQASPTQKLLDRAGHRQKYLRVTIDNITASS